ncbi:TerC family protein [Nicoliella spurrieriana]|uniref:TerC family protein n=1 Tax=Nicoliella spurrieriana TaxID=2925830 RepID=A0A976RSP0_9LACO|nr:TerC family protein [Nicoliella spurrieriana]UQS87138.1 TerC family protein [Nicoliella spurrieriana]
MLEILSKMYGPFFDLNNWTSVITSGSDWLVILSLVLIECLLSVDNAVVLAAQTQSLPTKKLQEESLFYGIWGSYIFRFLVIGLGTFLIHLWEIKVIGSLYLVYLVYKHFTSHGNDKKQVKKTHATDSKHHRRLFWMVVIQIEMMDIVFSVDSVLASLAISPNPVIVLIGGMIGILSMRGVAEVIMLLMKKIPELKSMAYVLIAIIAVKLFISIPAIDIEIPPLLFSGIVLVTVIITMIIHFTRKKRGTSTDDH